MSQQSRVVKPIEDNEIPIEISELADAISQLPADWRARVDPVMGKVVESVRRRRRILTLVQDALTQLRLDMKYLIFDLEATRRERDDFRRQLDQT